MIVGIDIPVRIWQDRNSHVEESGPPVWTTPDNKIEPFLSFQGVFEFWKSDHY